MNGFGFKKNKLLFGLEKTDQIIVSREEVM